MKHIYKNVHGQLLPVFLVLCLFIFSQCTTQKLSMQDGQKIEELGVCLQFGPNVPVEFQEKFEASLDQYILKFNTNPHAFKLTECQDNSSLQIRVEDVKYTTAGQRAAGIVVSALGLVAVPVTMVSAGAPFAVAFYYFPHNATLLTTAFTNDIAHPTLGAMPKVYNTGGMFGTDAFQREKHAKKFELHLNTLFMEVESSYKRTTRKKSRVVAQTNLPETEEAASN